MASGRVEGAEDDNDDLTTGRDVDEYLKWKKSSDNGWDDQKSG